MPPIQASTADPAQENTVNSLIAAYACRLFGVRDRKGRRLSNVDYSVYLLLTPMANDKKQGTNPGNLWFAQQLEYISEIKIDNARHTLEEVRLVRFHDGPQGQHFTLL